MKYLLSDGTSFSADEEDANLKIELHLLQAVNNKVYLVGEDDRVKELSRKTVFLEDKFNTDDWNLAFRPDVSPQEMLALGVFCGKYINGFKNELPEYWLKYAKIVDSSEPADVELNFYGVQSGQPLEVWQEKGWIQEPDECGWFQWYCRYYLGRRMHDYDQWQIGRWRSFVARHSAQVRKHCELGDMSCRPRQKQGLLQWAVAIDREDNTV